MRVREGGGGREGKIRLVTIARFSFSLAGICGGPMKLQQPCDIAREALCNLHITRSEVRETTDQICILEYSGANSSSYN